MGGIAGSGISLGTLSVAIEASVDQATRTIEGFNNDVGRMIDEQKSKWDTLGEIGGKLSGIGTSLTLITAPFAALGATAIKSAGDLESLKLALDTITGSSEETARQMARLKEIAKLPGLGLEEAVKGSVALQNIGIEAQTAERYLKAFGNAIAAAGGGKSDLEAVVVQLRQMGVNAKVTAEDLRPILDRVPQVAAVAKEAFGTINTEELQKAGVTAEQFLTTIVAGLEKIPPVAGGIKNSLENLGDSAKESMAKIGNALLPALEAAVPLIEKTLGMVGDLATKFSNLPEPVQNAALVVAGLAAALGPLLIVAGQVASSMAALGPIVAGAAAALGVSVGALALAVGAALAALVALGAWVYSNWDRIVAVLVQGWESVVAVFAAAGRAISDLASGKLPNFTQLLDDLKQSADKAATAVNRTGDAAKETAPKVEQLGKTTETTGAKTKVAKTELEKMKDEILASKAKADLHKQAMKELGLEVEKTGKKHDEAKTAVKKFNDEILLEKLRQAQTEHNKLVREIAAYEIAAEKAAGKTFDLNAEWEKLTASTNLGAMAISGVTAKLPPMNAAIEEANQAIQRQDAAYKALGVTSSAELARIAEAARVNYELIAGSGAASARDIDAAWVAMEEKRIAAARAMGETIAADQLTALEKMKAQLENKLPEMKRPFEGLASSVSTVITNFAQDISKSLWDGDMSWGEKGKSLLKSLGQAVTSAFVEPATKAITDLITGAIADLIGGKGFGGILDSIKDIGKGIGGIFGAGGSAAGGVGGAAGGVGGAGGAAGGIAGAAGGIMGAVGAIGGIASAISGIFGNFQMAGMNKTLDLIEKEVRYSQIHLLHILNNLNDFFHRDWWAGYQNIADIRTAIVDSMEPQLARAAQKIDFLKQLGENDFKPMLAAIAADTLHLERIMSATERIALASERSVNMNLYGTDPDVVAARIAQQLRLQGGNG